MKVTIRFSTLADAFAALMLANSGKEVLLIVPDTLWHLRRGVIMCRFLEEGVFGGGNKAMSQYGYNELASAAEYLHIVSSNTVYPEVVYAVQDKNFLRDFANHFRQKAYREISRPDKDVAILRSDVSISSDKVLRTAPAYRINYSRLVVALLRTLKTLGSEYKIVGVGECSDVVPIVNNDNSSFDEYNYYRLDVSASPTIWKSVYIPAGVWLYSRSGDFYIVAKTGVDVAKVLAESFDGYVLPDGALDNPIKISVSSNDLPMEALISAGNTIESTEGIERAKILDVDRLRLDGGKFEFSPSMADVVGYADYWYDIVKRLGINVAEFRDAVFDFGTNIEAIVDDTYNLYPTYHNGTTAFRAAVNNWISKEL